MTRSGPLIALSALSFLVAVLALFVQERLTFTGSALIEFGSAVKANQLYLQEVGDPSTLIPPTDV